LATYSAAPAAPSRREYFQLFLVTLFPIHAWAILDFLKRVPELALRMAAPEVAGVAAYVLAFALLESLLAFGVLLAASRLLPARFFARHLVPVGSVVVLLAAAAAAMIHYYGVLEVPGIGFGAWTALWVIGAAGLAVAARRLIGKSERLEKAGLAVAERLAVLSAVYLVIDVGGVFLIAFRNLA
jgi:hypothetical protein